MTTPYETVKAALESIQVIKALPKSDSHYQWHLARLEQIISAAQATGQGEAHDSEWFFRWIARGKAGYAGMTMEQCADMIWHSPANPYREKNPWKEDPEAYLVDAQHLSKEEYETISIEIELDSIICGKNDIDENSTKDIQTFIDEVTKTYSKDFLITSSIPPNLAEPDTSAQQKPDFNKLANILGKITGVEMEATASEDGKTTTISEAVNNQERR